MFQSSICRVGRERAEKEEIVAAMGSEDLGRNEVIMIYVWDLLLFFDCITLLIWLKEPELPYVQEISFFNDNCIKCNLRKEKK